MTTHQDSRSPEPWALRRDSAKARNTVGALWAATLTACGGGSPCTSAPTPITIQLFGDSTMAGLPDAQPAVLLQAAMDQKYGAGKVKVTSRAVPGSDSDEVIAGTDGLNEPWPKSVSADVVVVNFGLNDANRSVSIAQYTANLRLIAAAPARLVFETPNPAFLPNRISPGAYAEAMRQVASTTALSVVADTYAYAEETFNPWQPYMLEDGFHPNETGTGLIVSNSLAPAVAKQVDALTCR